MHICHITSVHPPYDTRIFQKQVTSASAFSQVTFIAPIDPAFQPSGANIRYIPIPNRRMRRLRFLFSPLIIIWHIFRLRPAVLHFHDPELLPVAFFFSLSMGRSVIFDMHEQVELDLLNKPYLPATRLIASAYQYILKLFCQYGTIILAEDSYQASLPADCVATIIHNYPRTELFTNTNCFDAHSHELLIIGALEGGGRGVEQAIAAITILNSQTANDPSAKPWHLHLYGRTSPQHAAYLRASFPESRAYYTLHGAMPLAEILDQIQHQKFLAGLALLAPWPNHIHSFPTKIGEYWGLHLPVIYSHFSDYQIWCGKAGLAVDPDDEQAIADTLALLAGNQDLAMECSRNSRAKLDQYSWDGEAQKLRELYQSLQTFNSPLHG